MKYLQTVAALLLVSLSGAALSDPADQAQIAQQLEQQRQLEPEQQALLALEATKLEEDINKPYRITGKPPP
jgi:hypothetical protein